MCYPPQIKLEKSCRCCGGGTSLSIGGTSAHQKCSCRNHQVSSFNFSTLCVTHRKTSDTTAPLFSCENSLPVKHLLEECGDGDGVCFLSVNPPLPPLPSQTYTSSHFPLSLTLSHGSFHPSKGRKRLQNDSPVPRSI